MAAAPRQAAIVAHLAEHPGLTAGELARAFGLRAPLYKQLYALEQRGQVVAVASWEPAQGRRVARWHPAPPGTVPPPPRLSRRFGERDRLAQRDRRSRSRAGRTGGDLPGRSRGLVPVLPDAACLSADPDLFFPVGAEDAADSRREEAKAICAGCPARLPCYEGAAARREPWGIWGGVDFGELARREAIAS